MCILRDSVHIEHNCCSQEVDFGASDAVLTTNEFKADPGVFRPANATQHLGLTCGMHIADLASFPTAAAAVVPVSFPTPFVSYDCSQLLWGSRSSICRVTVKWASEPVLRV